MHNLNLKIGILAFVVGIVLISGCVDEKNFCKTSDDCVATEQQNIENTKVYFPPTVVVWAEESINETGKTTTIIMQRGEKYYVAVIDLDNKTLKSIDVLHNVPEIKIDERSRIAVHVREPCNETDRITTLKIRGEKKYYVVVIDLDNKTLKSIDAIPIPKIKINESFLNGSIKQNAERIKYITIYNEGSETLNVEILPPVFVRVIETSFSIRGKLSSENLNKYPVKFYVDTSQTREIIGNITIKSNDPDRSEIKIPVNFTIIPHTEKELKAISIANATDEVKELQKQYSSYLSNSCFEHNVPYFSLVMHYEVKEVSPELIVVEYYILMCAYDINYLMIRITINSTSWKIIEKYPKIEYIKNSSYCERDGDCEPSSCIHRCANFIQRPISDIHHMRRSAYLPPYGCKCINNTCTAFDFEYYTESALREKNYSICEEIPMGRDKCIKEVAIATQNASLCDKIESDLKHVCLAITTKNETICKYAPFFYEWYKDFCYFEVAIAKQDPMICDKIVNTYTTLCFEKIAILKKDANLCDKIPVKDDLDNYYKVSCIAAVKQNTSLCYTLPEEWMRENCIGRVSEK